MLDYKSFVDHVSMPCCVISVEKAGDSYGAINIICANQAYREVMGPAYYDGMPYYELVPEDNKFEDYCFQSAVNGKRMHAYVETKALNCWTDQTMIPLRSDDEGVGYCQFIFEFTQKADVERMSHLNMGVAEAVVKANIVLMQRGDFKESVGKVLDIIMEATGAEASRIMLADDERKKAVIFSERMILEAWSDRMPENASEDVISYDLIKTWKEAIGVSNEVLIRNERDMDILEEKSPDWVRSMRENGVRTIVLIPLGRGDDVTGELNGYLYVVNFDEEKAVEIKELVELMSFSLGSEIANYLYVKRIEREGNVDALTGLGNRHAMLHRMKKHVPGEPFGIINLDLNGLKRVNDECGHDAGDRLLVQAGEILRKIFYDDDLYRTGGDEYIVLSSDISEMTFMRKVQRLREDACKNSEVSFAMGVYWSDGGTDMRTAFKLADERMYTDKADFYKTHSSLKRR